MQDPIGSFERIRELYLSYLDTAFRISDESVAEERRTLLRRPGTLCTEPLIEPIPRYEPMRRHDGEPLTFDDLYVDESTGAPLAGFKERARRAFVDLALAGLFPSSERPSGGLPLKRKGRFPPYRHQVEMLAKGVRAGTPGIVTSGTGSGKTEAFLLPILAQLAREAVDWDAPKEGYLARRWWIDPRTRQPYSELKNGSLRLKLPSTLKPDTKEPLRTVFRRHRAGESPKRKAAVRALVLYPMNALVEDQLVRLRKALDSREARGVMDEHFKMNRIFFGRYIGATEVTGHPGVKEPRGLDSFLAAGKKAAKALGAIRWPGHKLANENGDVDYEDLWTDEKDRRTRRLTQLFESMVELERAQIEARLHALNAVAEGRLRMLVHEYEARNGKSPDATAFLGLAKSAGKRTASGLVENYRKVVGTPDQVAIESLSKPQLTEKDATDAPSAFTGENSPFMFPSVEGCEMNNRWDMQLDPPDILITNVSMLSAMLNREVEEPIFDKTREWLKQDGAYFYLVLDELHLQRGAAGTEVSFLLRMLLERLGLVQSAEQRGKLRVLASSASLPGFPDAEAAKSSQYLWDFFGAFGLPPDNRTENESKRLWRNAIVPGKERAGRYPPTIPLDGLRLSPEPFRALLRAHREDRWQDPDLPLAQPVFAKIPNDDDDLGRAWARVCDALGVDRGGGLRRAISACVEEATQRLLVAVWDRDEGRSRAQPLSKLAIDLFAEAEQADEKAADLRLEAIRGLLFVRGAGDGLSEVGYLERLELPSFRVHTFFRSIEGLYAPAYKGLGSPKTKLPRRADVGCLTVDQAQRIAIPTPDGVSEHRLFELIYCECCGELFFGGMRADVSAKSRYAAELLPQEPRLEGLPDNAASQRFEDLSWEQYALFWPASWKAEGLIDENERGQWREGILERETGGILKRDRIEESALDSGKHLVGWYYDRSGNDAGHKRRWDSPGTNVPYACPSCLTSYAGRPDRRYRLSPLRNFRAGFAKTTQLLATELFDAQRVSNPAEAPKLVSFSDSRQDAARAALSIERNHHQDVRRELLVSTLRRHLAGRATEVPRLEQEHKELELSLASAPPAALKVLKEVFKSVETKLASARETSVLLSDVLGEETGVVSAESRVPELIAEMARSGIHPYDGAGIDRPQGQGFQRKQKHFPWNRLFSLHGATGALSWNNSEDAEQAHALANARAFLVREVHRVMTDVVFSKTYFSLEESGLGYATVPAGALSGPSEERRRRAGELSALIRVMADSYRYWPTPYAEKDKDGNDTMPFEWREASQVSSNRVKKYAQAVWPADWETQLTIALQELANAGHGDGIIQISRVRIQLVGSDSTYVRCQRCARVHLHPGAGCCTRCFANLNWSVSAKRPVAELHVRSFLARRIQRASNETSERTQRQFRLHCEELTGQTEVPAERQRQFRGVFLPRLEELDAISDEEVENNVRVLGTLDLLYKRKSEIDLLAVTTTMEVGIDIGPLEVVLQANMPPQRFNYQQRVGRAGRRGQAYSFVLTICRTKSHDVFYFQEPKAMTGDVPPTPFLTKRMENIGERLVRKGWLAQAFRRLRKEMRQSGWPFPGDFMNPPDIHGEYLPVFLFQQDDWHKRTREALESELGYARQLAELLQEGTALNFQVEVPSLLLAMQMAVDLSQQSGLAHGLAESGLLPMYGMPTRVRDLYMGLGWATGQRSWSTVDRDLDIAIYEFAPGATIVLDKREHLAVGFTPTLSDPVKRKGGEVVYALQDSAFGQTFELIQCMTCQAWTHVGGKELVEKCECGAALSRETKWNCRVPNAFRTDLPRFARSTEEEGDSGIRHRSIQAEAAEIKFQNASGFGPDGGWTLPFRHKISRTFRLNRGPNHDAGGRYFEVREGTDSSLGPKLPRQVICTDNELHTRVKGFAPEAAPTRLWLAAPKTTDSLYLAAHGLVDGMALHRLYSQTDEGTSNDEVTRWLGIRAAAISASFLLASRAAFELDVDPEEFDVLEPRRYSKEDPRPLLHITDHLVNGAGYCDWLVQQDDNQPRIARLIESVLEEPSRYPLKQFLSPKHKGCDSSCYRCMRRYGNQPYHGLLDWQLGLSFLRAMVDSSYQAGLVTGDFDRYVETRRWPEFAAGLASQMAERFDGDARSFGSLPAFRVRIPGRRLSPWVLVRHPLWDWSQEDGPPPNTLLAEAYAQTRTEGGPPMCWDTFNLLRRQVLVREKVVAEARRQ